MRWEVVDIQSGSYVRLLAPYSFGEDVYPAGTVGKVQFLHHDDHALVQVERLCPGLGTSYVYFIVEPDDMEPVQVPKITTLHAEAGRWEMEYYFLPGQQVRIKVSEPKLPSGNRMKHMRGKVGYVQAPDMSPYPDLVFVAAADPERGSWGGYFRPQDIELIDRPDVEASLRWEVQTDMDVSLPPHGDVFHFNLEAGTYWSQANNDRGRPMCIQAAPSNFRRVSPGKWEYWHPHATTQNWSEFLKQDSKIIEQQYRKTVGSV